MAEIDDICGTKPHRPFPPRPHAIRDALLSVVIHNLATHLGDPKAKEQIQNLASSLFATSGRAIAG